MNSIRKTFILVAGIAAMSSASAAFAGINGRQVEQIRSQQRDGGSSQSQSSPAPVYSAPAASAPAAAPAPRMQESRPSSRSDSRAVSGDQSQRAVRPTGPNPNRSANPRNPPAANAAAPNARSQPNARESGNRPDERRNADATRSGNRGVLGGAASRNNPGNNPGGGNNGGGHHTGGGGNGGNHDNGDHHPQRPPRVVYVLPSYYNDYYWNNSWYYNFDGGWYSPYGGSYVSVGAPYGMFVRTLPGYSSSFYYGEARYYLHDNTYYTYDRSRGGYVVAPSPYGDDEEYDDAVDEDLYIYPAQGQSEEQQADDRYACHRWGVKESGYDPIDDDYDADRRASYLRAMSACLTGRGYTVK